MLLSCAGSVIDFREGEAAAAAASMASESSLSDKASSPDSLLLKDAKRVLAS